MPSLLYGPPWLNPEKIFQNKGSQKAGKRYLKLVFANTVIHKGAVLLIFNVEHTGSVLQTCLSTLLRCYLVSENLASKFIS